MRRSDFHEVSSGMSKDAVKFMNFANAHTDYTKKNVKFMKGTRTKREIHEIR